MYYYYKIENKINHNKYIGITTTPDIRKNRHFNYLRKNIHFNPHLQAAFNKYGEENFYFEILENKDFTDPKEAYNYEAILIQKYDTYNNGYNCNPGGVWTGPRGRFTKNEVFYIKSAFYFEKQCGRILAKIFNCPEGTIYNIKSNRNYKPWCQEFDSLSILEKKMWYEDFCSLSNFPSFLKKVEKKENLRKLSKEQVFFILLNEEFHLLSWAELRRKYNNPNRGENYIRIRRRQTYKDYCEEYDKLSLEEKTKMLCLYTEMYIE